MNLLENKANQIKAKMEGNMATKSDLKWLKNYEAKKKKK